MRRSLRFALPLAAAVALTCTRGDLLVDAGEALIDLGQMMEPDAGAHTGNEMRLTLPCNQMNGAVFSAISEPLGADPSQLKNVFTLVCDGGSCVQGAVFFDQGRIRVDCLSSSSTAFVNVVM